MLRHWLDADEPVTRYRVGRINDTWMVGERYVLQRVNGTVFAVPQAVMRNQAKVLAHDATLLVPPVPTRAGEKYVIDRRGDLWRLFPRRASRNFQTLPEPLFRVAAEAYGSFVARFEDLTHPLEPVIEGFHDLERYLAALDDAPPGAATERRTVDALRGAFGPPRQSAVIHGDCKVNNLLFHRTRDEVVAIIDLDTVMAGDPAWDFGDLVRSAFSGTEEHASAPPLSSAGLEALAGGFVRGMGAVDDVERFADAPAYMSFMLGVRFLNDHLRGDVYFGVRAHGDNLRRARGQLALARSFLDVRSVVASALHSPPSPATVA